MAELFEPVDESLFEAVDPPKKPEGGRAAAFAQGLSERFIGNVLGIPQAGVDIATQNIAPVLFGGPPSKVDLGMPSGADAAAAIDSLAGGTVDESRQRRAATQEANPGFTAAGDFGGDVATLLTGRLPRTGPGGMLDESVEKLVASFAKRMGTRPTGVRSATKDILENETFKKMLRGLGRSTETGIEGAALELMQGGDPLETAAFAAGGQLISSSALTLANSSVSWPIKALSRVVGRKLNPGKITEVLTGITANAVLATTFLNVAQNVIPGGSDSPLDAEESAYDKIVAGLVIGLALGLPGKRPKAGGLLERFPNLADTILTAGRTGIIKLAQAMAEDPVVERAVVAMGSQPEAFSRKQLERFNNAVEEGDDLAALISDFLEEPKFRAAIEAPLPDLVNVPRKEPDGRRGRNDPSLRRRAN